MTSSRRFDVLALANVATYAVPLVVIFHLVVMVPYRLERIDYSAGQNGGDIIAYGAFLPWLILGGISSNATIVIVIPMIMNAILLFLAAVVFVLLLRRATPHAKPAVCRVAANVTSVVIWVLAIFLFLAYTLAYVSDAQFALSYREAGFQDYP